jgi:hypothetical protein
MDSKHKKLQKCDLSYELHGNSRLGKQQIPAEAMTYI